VYLQYNNNRVLKIFLFILFIYFYCCAGWKYIVAFTKDLTAGDWWFTPVILATQEAEIRRIVV
jgi:hypothetical protein